MTGYIVKRLFTALILLYVVATVVFFLLFLVPGDPAVMLLSSGGVAPPPEAVTQLRQEMGLDKPVVTQYVAYLDRIAHGDLGSSFQDHTPVTQVIADRLPRTLELVGAAALLSVLVGIPLGVISARRMGEWPDRALKWLTGIALSVPVFVIGTVLMLLFSQILGWFPAGGYASFGESPARHLQSLLLPTLTIAIGFTSMVLRMARSTVLGVIDKDWVRTARAKGLTERKVWRRHIVRNSLGPVVTLTGLQIGSLIGGTVLVEYVFNWPGLSGMLVTAVDYRDYPEVQGVVLVVAALFILINLVADVIYPILDPRARSK
ncbi:ABC transporter permease [Paraburkholderia sp. J8-2]|uniref:ABC transporter permease n=1 Tax=Paraburkholderia sp. J8-2 TaxID=2805440 RepID=UPI002AB7735C|nr:ABC transporter permease [Paraburkholderia sp. J8-2]